MTAVSQKFRPALRRLCHDLPVAAWYVVALLIARVVVLRCPLGKVIQALTKFAARRALVERAQRNEVDILAIAAAHTRCARIACRIVPVRAMCLEQSIAVAATLAYYGVCLKVVFGVSNDPVNNFYAHAWLQVNGIDVDVQSADLRALSSIDVAIVNGQPNSRAPFHPVDTAKN